MLSTGSDIEKQKKIFKGFLNFAMEKSSFFILLHSTMFKYKLVKKLGSYVNFKGLKPAAKVLRHKLFARNKLSAPTVCAQGTFCFRPRGIILDEPTQIRWFSRCSSGAGWSGRAIAQRRPRVSKLGLGEGTV
jgi:hypothetical protein